MLPIIVVRATDNPSDAQHALKHALSQLKKQLKHSNILNDLRDKSEFRSRPVRRRIKRERAESTRRAEAARHRRKG